MSLNKTLSDYHYRKGPPEPKEVEEYPSAKEDEDMDKYYDNKYGKKGK